MTRKFITITTYWSQSSYKIFVTIFYCARYSWHINAIPYFCFFSFFSPSVTPSPTLLTVLFKVDILSSKTNATKILPQNLIWKYFRALEFYVKMSILNVRESRVPPPEKRIPKYFTISRHLFATFAIFLPLRKLSNFPRIRKLWIQRALERFCCYIYIFQNECCTVLKKRITKQITIKKC